MPETSKGKLIVIEGIDGCGKTTQLRLLKSRLTASGRKAFTTSEPTCKSTHRPTDPGALLGSVLKGEKDLTPSCIAGLFLADRIAHNTDPRIGIRFLTDNGTDVICARYYYSTLVYQGSPDLFDWILKSNLDCPDIKRPDICFFLDVDPETSADRIGNRGEKAEIYEKSTDMLREARNSYFRVFDEVRKYDPKQRIEIIDASASIQEMADAIFRKVAEII